MGPLEVECRGHPGLTALISTLHRGELPDRYGVEWMLPFTRLVGEELRPKMSILDVGAGAHPTLSPLQLPTGARYVGMDISASELRRAPTGSYSETIVADICMRDPALEAGFDLIVCFQVLEHVRPLPVALENLRRYLKPGGRLVAQVSGAFSATSLANRIVPNSVTPLIVSKLMRARSKRDVFPAHYDKCWATALRGMSDRWAEFDVIPLFIAGQAFWFFRPIQAVVVGLEEWACANRHHNLASHYLISSRR